MAFDHTKKKSYEALGISEKDSADIKKTIQKILDNPEEYNSISKQIECILSVGFKYEEVAYASYVLAQELSKKNNSDPLVSGNPMLFGPFSMGSSSAIDPLISLLGASLSRNQSLFNKDSDEDDSDEDDNDLNDKYKK